MSHSSDKLRVIRHLAHNKPPTQDRNSAACGSWPSTLSAADVAAAGNSLLGLTLDDHGGLWWLELRPGDQGRHVLVRQTSAGPQDITPPSYSVRSRVHEYGGASFCLHGNRVWFCNDADQRVYCQSLDDHDPPRPLTPEGVRFADLIPDARRQRLIGVFEDHRQPGEAKNGIAAIAFAGGFEPLWQASDFVAGPCLSPDAQRLAFVAWDHPNMPWDNTRLMLTEIDSGGQLQLTESIGNQESLCEPRFSDDGRLYVISDRSNWWNLYRVDGKRLQPIREESAEYGAPAWQLGASRYQFLDTARAVVCINRDGLESLAVLDLVGGGLTPLELSQIGFSSLAVYQGRVHAIASAWDDLPAIIAVDCQTGHAEKLYQASRSPLDHGEVAPVQVIEFISGTDRTAHAFYHAPHSSSHTSLDGEKPPLIVSLHGGPTAQSSAALSLGIQYWTSRGFAVVNVNYGGSTGYGRQYRQSLYGQWGIVDVEDAAMAAQRLAEAGLADPQRLLIRGGSAGGYTTLAALAFTDTFAAGANYYGVSDAMALAEETHKFESRYLDQLIGPLPEAGEIYRQRSPIHHLQGFDSPLITFQGLEDKIVPPDQSQAIFDALRAKGVATAYITYAGEQHGFRRAENQIRSLEAELYFYGRVLGFTPADSLQPVDIVNL